MTHFFSRHPQPYCEQGTIYELYTCNDIQNQNYRRLLSADLPFAGALRSALKLPEDNSNQLTLDASLARIYKRGFFRTNMDIFFIHQKTSALMATSVMEGTEHSRADHEIHAYGLLAHLRVWYDQVIHGWENFDMEFMWKSTDIQIAEYEKMWTEAYHKLVPSHSKRRTGFFNRENVSKHLQRLCALKEVRTPVKQALCKINPKEISSLAELGVLMWLVWYHDEETIFVDVFGTSIPFATSSYFAHVPLVSMMMPEQMKDFMSIHSIKNWVEEEVNTGRWAEPSELVARMKEHNAQKKEVMELWFESHGLDMEEIRAKWKISCHEVFKYMKPHIQKTMKAFNWDIDSIIESVATIITTENVKAVTEHHVEQTLRVVEEQNLSDSVYFGKYADMTRFQMKMMAKCMAYMYKTIIKPEFEVPMMEEPALKVAAEMMNIIVDSLDNYYQTQDMIAKAIVFIMNFRLFMGMNSFYLAAQAYPGDYQEDHEVCTQKI